MEFRNLQKTFVCCGKRPYRDQQSEVCEHYKKIFCGPQASNTHFSEVLHKKMNVEAQWPCVNLFPFPVEGTYLDKMVSKTFI